MDNTNLPSTQNIASSQSPIAILKTLGTFTKIKDFDKIGHLVIPICNKHAVLSGIDKEIDQFTKEEIAKYTATHLKNLSIEEIELAFQNERFNLYDNKTIHYNFFSIDYFVEIIKKYIHWKQNQMAIHNIPINQILIPANTNNQENIKQIRKEFVTLIFNELKQTKQNYIHDAFTLYEDFVEQKLITISDQDKITLYKVILNEVKTETIQEISTTLNRTLKNKLKVFLDNLNKNAIKNVVANRCKAYLVCKSIDSFQNLDSLLKKINI